MISSPVSLSSVTHKQNARIRLLIVEDDANCRWVLSALLKRMGYLCRTAEDGSQAVEMARTFAPDLILMDIMMPVLDGLAATRLLKADDRTKKIPILALSANNTESGVEAARRAGCDDFMTKPVVLDDLIEWVETHTAG